MGSQNNTTGHDREAEASYSVRSEFFAPPDEFAGCFTTFYRLDLEVHDGATLHDHLQPEWANLRFFAGGRPTSQIGNSRVSGARFVVTGPSSLPCQFELGAAKMWGIGLLPLGWARLIDEEASSLANTIFDGAKHPAFAKFDEMSEALCDPEASVEEQQVALAECLGRIMQPNRDEPKIVRVHQAIVGGDHVSVGDLAGACGMSIRTLERVCHRYFGFTPKLLMRRQRFMRSLTNFMVHEASRWTEAMDGEYHDQAQFTREFTEFMTMTPSAYGALDHPILSSFMEARARIWGSAAQTLDLPRKASG